jgi:hypothetical protein
LSGGFFKAAESFQQVFLQTLRFLRQCRPSSKRLLYLCTELAFTYQPIITLVLKPRDFLTIRPVR